MSDLRSDDSRVLLIFLLYLAVAVPVVIVLDRARRWLWDHMPEKFATALTGALIAVIGLRLSNEERPWVWIAWIVILGALGWWIAHRVMGSVQSRIEERREMFRRGVPPSSSEGYYAGWRDLGRIYEREKDPAFQAFLRHIASMTENDWRSFVPKAKGLVGLRRARALRAMERIDPDVREVATTAILEALAKASGPRGAAQVHALDARCQVARPAGEALLARHRIGKQLFDTLYQPFEAMLPASRLLAAVRPAPD